MRGTTAGFRTPGRTSEGRARRCRSGCTYRSLAPRRSPLRHRHPCPEASPRRESRHSEQGAVLQRAVLRALRVCDPGRGSHRRQAASVAGESLVRLGHGRPRTKPPSHGPTDYRRSDSAVGPVRGSPPAGRWYGPHLLEDGLDRRGVVEVGDGEVTEVVGPVLVPFVDQGPVRKLGGLRGAGGSCTTPGRRPSRALPPLTPTRRTGAGHPAPPGMRR
jgi:hypothetical protein